MSPRLQLYMAARPHSRVILLFNLPFRDIHRFREKVIGSAGHRRPSEDVYGLPVIQLVEPLARLDLFHMFVPERATHYYVNCKFLNDDVLLLRLLCSNP